MKVLVHNDGKGKYQSFSAWAENVDANIGYGATKEEAIEDLKNNVLQLSEQLKKINFEDIIMVDYFGRALEKK